MATSVGDWPIRRFCRQYLQVEASLDYPSGLILREHHVQEYLYEELFAFHAQDHASGPPRVYALRVLKTLARIIEDNIEDWDLHGISDNLMMCLADRASSGPSVSDMPSPATTEKRAVTYYVSAVEGAASIATPPTITLLEDRFTIAAGGTTGIRTWEAALHLGNYLCQNRDIVEAKRVLELGTGTGYVSILCAKFLHTSHCIATDGSFEVIDSMSTNLRLNNIEAESSVSPRELQWGDNTLHNGPDHKSGGKGADENVDLDVVLGADITFDERDMPDLLKTIRWCVSSNGNAIVFISATERNRKTYEAFVSLAAVDFEIEKVDFPVPEKKDQNGPFYSDAVPIHICQLRKTSPR